MKIKPLGNRIVVQQDEPETNEATGGIIVPETVTQGYGAVVGTVVAAADSRLAKAKAGDRIVFSSHSGTSYEEDGKDYLIMTYSDILGVIVSPPVCSEASFETECDFADKECVEHGGYMEEGTA